MQTEPLPRTRAIVSIVSSVAGVLALWLALIAYKEDVSARAKERCDNATTEIDLLQIGPGEGVKQLRDALIVRRIFESCERSVSARYVPLLTKLWGECGKERLNPGKEEQHCLVYKNLIEAFGPTN